MKGKIIAEVLTIQFCKIGNSVWYRFATAHLLELHAINHGVGVRGFFYGSLLDNFEWQFGYTKKFGLLSVDFNDEKLSRKMTRTGEFYRGICSGVSADRRIGLAKYMPGFLPKAATPVSGFAFFRLRVYLHSCWPHRNSSMKQANSRNWKSFFHAGEKCRFIAIRWSVPTAGARTSIVFNGCL
ncbi:MAG TPA: family 1 glycosylhydrolase [Verrucomicrobiae bacterium]